MMILYIIGLYLITGVIFSIPFLGKWIYTIDESARESSWTFKLTILPGCIVFWPVLAEKCIHHSQGNDHD